jgi:hypothetical protein
MSARLYLTNSFCIGLSHIVFAQAGSGLIELRPPGFETHPHFKHLAAYSGVLYSSLPIGPDSGRGHPVFISPLATGIKKMLLKLR